MGKRWKRSYSFDGEDMIIGSYFQENKGGYIDVGSGRPIRGSNTYHFYKKGWKGICIDPIPLNHFAHKLIRSRDFSLNIICGSKNQTIKFYEFKPNEFSTSSEDVAKSLLKRGIPLIRTYNKQSQSLSKIVNENNITEPSFLNIDVEGKDFEVLISNDFDIYRPRVICIEEYKLFSSGGLSKIDRFLKTKEYTLVGRSKYSSIYCCNNYLKQSGALYHLNI